MKREILDSPFHCSFPDFLKKGETIIWEGQPSTVTHLGNEEGSENFNTGLFTLAFVCSMIALLYEIDNASRAVVLILVIVVFAIVIPWWKRKDRNNFEYAISQNQVLFKMKEKWKGQDIVYSIPFTAIKNIVVVMTFDTEKLKEYYSFEQDDDSEMYSKDGLEKIGTIFIVAHEPQTIEFDTLDLMNNEKRHQPTLELLEDAEAVAKIIRAGIKNNS